MVAARLGTAFTMPAAAAAAIEAAPADRAGAASGALNAARRIGGVLGVAVLGGFIAGHSAPFVTGFHAAVTVAAAGFVCAAVLTALSTGRRAVGR